MNTVLKPYRIKGGITSDSRGRVVFVNEFNFKRVKRFYIVENNQLNYFRGWHAHKHEEKYIFVASGKILLAFVKVTNWDNPSKKSKIASFYISEKEPTMIHIPPGYANGFMSLVPNTKVIFFSNFTLKQSLHDDYRYNPTYWNIEHTTKTV